MVDGGPAATSVALTVPPVVTVKLLKSSPPTGTVPVKVSVTSVPVGAVMFELSPLAPPHAAVAATRASTSPSVVERVMSGVSQFVADTTNGEDVTAVVGLDAPAQTADQRVHASHRDEVVPSPDSGEQPLAAEHHAGMAGQHVQQLKLLLGQRHAAVADEHVAPGR